ncbi:MAG: hypothetical protein CL927_02345 [Deltaproteobacteria bacterium]|nr:hypothetical protein [Deltaproteobacteria bacterium]HCH66247.1 hypothetical protein [Deltaproteobacteria bacterium]
MSQDDPATSPKAPLTPASLEHASRDVLVPGATALVSQARAEADHDALSMLGALRRILLMRNERPALALTLKAQGELAGTLGQFTLAADAFDTEWGVRELLDQPFKAHRARLDRAEALFFAGLVDDATRALRQAQKPARDLALGGQVHEASIQLADTLARLAGVLRAEQQGEEADLWLEGALEIAPDAETRAMVAATPGRFTTASAGQRTL